MTAPSRLSRLFAVFLVLAVWAAPACSQESEPSGKASRGESAEVGKPAVQSEIGQLEYRELLDLIDASKGKVVLVNFWATWCPPCREELPELMRLRERYSEDQLVVLGVSVDDNTGLVKKFMRDTPFNYPVYWRTPELLAAYQVNGVPYTVVYDRQGHMADDMVGYQPGKVEAVVDGLVEKSRGN